MKRTFIALGTILVTLPIAVVAHHSFAAEYDGSKAMNLVGLITKVDQQNPHGFFYMSVPSATPGGRATTWALETPGPNQLVRTGFPAMYKEMIDNKEMVTVKGYPARDGSKRAFAESVTRADKKTVINISVGGVDSNVGRAPQGGSVTVDGVVQPGFDVGLRGGAGGGAGGGRGGAGGGQRGGAAPQGGEPK